MKFELPPLPYEKSALEPYIGARTLEFHYEKHHRGYLTKLEEVIAQTPQAEKSLVQVIRESDGNVFNLAAQVWNHSFYWDSMRPNGGGEPRGELASAIERDFGNYASFAKKFAAAANGEFGSGWGWLVVSRDGKLAVINSSDAENPLQSGQTPILTVDVWEHAYYLDYQNERNRYVGAFVDHLINWDFADRNFADAKLRG
jgi:Fe-Mn family superoxide dismutase